jgi:hypothetical protein
LAFVIPGLKRNHSQGYGLVGVDIDVHASCPGARLVWRTGVVEAGVETHRFIVTLDPVVGFLLTEGRNCQRKDQQQRANTRHFIVACLKPNSTPGQVSGQRA